MKLTIINIKDPDHAVRDNMVAASVGEADLLIGATRLIAAPQIEALLGAGEGGDSGADIPRIATTDPLGIVDEISGRTKERISVCVLVDAASDMAGYTELIRLLGKRDIPFLTLPVKPFGIPDGAFIRQGSESNSATVPMIRREVRWVAAGLLSVRQGECVWDIGAGVGSVAIEFSRLTGNGDVYAIESRDDACALIRANAVRLGADGIHIIHGRVPEALAGLPAPDAVFIGGSRGSLGGLFDTIYAANPRARVCIASPLLEITVEALRLLRARGLRTEATELAVSRSRLVNGQNMMLAQHPIILISAVPDGAEA